MENFGISFLFGGPQGFQLKCRHWTEEIDKFCGFVNLQGTACMSPTALAD